MISLKTFALLGVDTTSPAALHGPMRHDERPRAARPRVLLIEEDPRDGETFIAALRTLPLETVWFRSGLQGLAASRHERFDLLLVDRDLPDISGRDVVRLLRADDDAACFILVTGLVSAAVAIDALRLGALGLMAKPFNADDLIDAVNAALTSRRGQRPADLPSRTALPAMRIVPPSAPLPRSTPGSIAERWARFVLNTVHAEQDPKTIGTWSKSIGVSRTVLCECCRLVHISPHDARDFVRVMRAIWRCGKHWQPETVLDLADARTLKRLLHRAGLNVASRVTPTTEEFLDRQQWIARTNPGLAALRTLLGETTVPRPSSDVGELSPVQWRDF